jgi:hypothetical protein
MENLLSIQGMNDSAWGFLTPKQLFEVGDLTENIKMDAAARGKNYVGGV